MAVRHDLVQTSDEEIGRRTIRKVTWHLLPFLFILYVIAYLDRVNFGFAALEMNSALGLSSEVFGILSGIFFIGYLIFEVPSNMILQRTGARVWIARILISWGIVVMVTACATDALQLAGLRFILGVAEAGFFPGIILYITCWFRQRELARAVALFMTALTVSTIIGAPVSTWIMDNIQWLGIAGWRWLFVIEGLPAVILGIVTWFYLTDRPEDAAWLEPDEKTWLIRALQEDQKTCSVQNGSPKLLSLITDLRIWHLAIIYCMLTIGLYGLGFWMPQIIRSLNQSFTNFEIGMIMVVPYACACIAMVLWSRHSDTTGERRWHAAAPPLIGGIALAGAGIAADPRVAFFLIIIATVGIFCCFGPFWTLPALFFTGAAAAIGIAVVNSIGNVGGFIGPSLMGFLAKSTGGMFTGLIVMGGCLVTCGLLAAAVRK